VNGFGRRPLNIVVTKVCDALRLYRSVLAAANELGCSRAYIYKVLKANGLTVAGVIKELATKDTRLLHKGVLNDGR
jgi:hypothetical protein